MTTIACNRKEIAGDSLVSLDGVGSDEFLSKKLYRIGKSIFGETGENCNDVGIAIEWLRSGRKPRNRPRIAGGGADFLLLELSPEGIFVWNTSLTRDPLLEMFAAVGSGRKVALYCMKHLGMTPEKAVQEAAKVDRYTKSPVYVERLR